jgi:phage FluMu protein Com
MTKLTEKEWHAEGVKRYGDDKKEWKFRCPSCKVSTQVQEWLDNEAQNQIAFSCIGRSTGSENSLGSKEQPCNYAGGGLFKLNPLTIIYPDGTEGDAFNFADDPLAEEKA